MKIISVKNIFTCCLVSTTLLAITSVNSEAYAEEVRASANEESRFSFNYDQEIPTLIRYGDKVSGVMSKTGYIGFIQRDDGTSRISIDIGYNITLYELQEPPSMGRLISMFGFGYVPFLEIFSLPGFVCNEGTKGIDIGMISPVVGYSYSRQLLSWFRLGFSIHGAPAYCNKIIPWSSRAEFEEDGMDRSPGFYNYDKWVTAYDAIGNISGKWGARLNPKIKLYLLNISGSNDAYLGLGFGYAQYVFANNHFNSYDIGLDFTMVF